MATMQHKIFLRVSEENVRRIQERFERSPRVNPSSEQRTWNTSTVWRVLRRRLLCNWVHLFESPCILYTVSTHHHQCSDIMYAIGYTLATLYHYIDDVVYWRYVIYHALSLCLCLCFILYCSPFLLGSFMQSFVLLPCLDFSSPLPPPFSLLSVLRIVFIISFFFSWNWYFFLFLLSIFV